MEEFPVPNLTKKNVYMVQINAEYNGSVYLPYAIGSIAAYAWQNETIENSYNLKPFVYLRKDAVSLPETVDAPSIVAFSAYIWNFELCKWCAQKIKESYPTCIIIFGGHSTPESTEFLAQHNFIDFLVNGEGEEPFTELLCALSGEKDLHSVSNIIYREVDGKAVKSKTRTIVTTDYPSPYIEGYFEEILQTELDIKFSMILETNRGCPYHCSYCDWGFQKDQVRQFSLERVYSEINWLCTHKIDYLYCADANFGIFTRDMEIAKKIVDSKIKTSYPKKFHVNYTKNSNKTVFEINKLFDKHGLSKGATLSFQSFSPDVLKNIQRTNITFKRFSELMNLYNSNNIMTYSELILCLPGETYESFKHSLGKLLEAGQHSSIIVLNCHWLVNSEMGNPEYVKKHEIQTVPAPIHQTHSVPAQEGELKEYSPLVVSTSTMSRDMWVRTAVFSFCVLCFHCFGLLQYFALYLFKEHAVKYESFYELLLRWLEDNPHSVSGKIFTNIRDEVTKASQGRGSWFYTNKLFGNITWPFEEGMFLEIAYHSEQFYSEIIPFLEQFDMDPLLLKELMSYQKHMLKLPGIADFEFNCKYDFYEYFSSIYAGQKPSLNKKKNIIRITDRTVPGNWEQYAVEVVWFGRRGGQCLHSEVEQIYS